MRRLFDIAISSAENVVERALILSDGPVLASNPMFLGGVRGEAPPAFAGTLAEVERRYILDVLRECGWRVAGVANAAERLGLNRSTLLSRMKKLGISRAEPEGRGEKPAQAQRKRLTSAAGPAASPSPPRDPR